MDYFQTIQKNRRKRISDKVKDQNSDYDIDGLNNNYSNQYRAPMSEDEWKSFLVDIDETISFDEIESFDKHTDIDLEEEEVSIYEEDNKLPGSASKKQLSREKRSKLKRPIRYKFVDKAVISVSGGTGGRGCISFDVLKPGKKKATGGSGE